MATFCFFFNLIIVCLQLMFYHKVYQEFLQIYTHSPTLMLKCVEDTMKVYDVDCVDITSKPVAVGDFSTLVFS